MGGFCFAHGKIVYNPKDVYNYTTRTDTSQGLLPTIYKLFIYSPPFFLRAKQNCAKKAHRRAVGFGLSFYVGVDLYKLRHDIGGFVHALDGNVLEGTVEGVTARAEIGARKTHKRET